MKMTIYPNKNEIEAARQILINKVTQGVLIVRPVHTAAIYSLLSRVIMRAPKVKHTPKTPNHKS